MSRPHTYIPPNLRGKIALVAGATRGAGRGIAVALGEAGATVYCTGRSSRSGARDPGAPGRPPVIEQTIEETAEMVTAAGGKGIAVRVDHSEPAQVQELAARIKGEQKGLDILVNDIWGGDPLTQFGKRFWETNLENGLLMLKQAIQTHIITSYFSVPLMLGRRGAVVFEITDGDGFQYRGNLFYDLVKISVIRLAFAMDRELRKFGVVSLALTPGFLRSEAVLEHFGVTESNWKSARRKVPPGRKKRVVHDATEDFMQSETPRYVGRALAAVAADPNVAKKRGRVFSSWALCREYRFTDVDGSHPDWGRYATKKYGAYKICDDRFYSYWAPGLVEKIFPDWF